MSEYASLRCASLSWRQSETEQGVYKLLRGNILAGRLAISSRPKNAITASCSEGEWAMQWSGFLADRLDILIGSGEKIATLEYPYTTSGRCKFNDESGFLIKVEGLLGNKWQVVDDEGHELLLYHPAPLDVRHLLRNEADVSVSLFARQVPNLPVLVFGTWAAILSSGWRSSGGG